MTFQAAGRPPRQLHLVLENYLSTILSCLGGLPAAGECKSWTLDSGLDHGLDYGLEYGLNFRLIYKPGLGPGAMFRLGTAQESPQEQLAGLQGNLALLL